MSAVVLRTNDKPSKRTQWQEQRNACTHRESKRQPSENQELDYEIAFEPTPLVFTNRRCAVVFFLFATFFGLLFVFELSSILRNGFRIYLNILINWRRISCDIRRFSSHFGVWLACNTEVDAFQPNLFCVHISLMVLCMCVWSATLVWCLECIRSSSSEDLLLFSGVVFSPCQMWKSRIQPYVCVRWGRTHAGKIFRSHKERTTKKIKHKNPTTNIDG